MWESPSVALSPRVSPFQDPSGYATRWGFRGVYGYEASEDGVGGEEDVRRSSLLS